MWEIFNCIYIGWALLEYNSSQCGSIKNWFSVYEKDRQIISLDKHFFKKKYIFDSKIPKFYIPTKMCASYILYIVIIFSKFEKKVKNYKIKRPLNQRIFFHSKTNLTFNSCIYTVEDNI